MSGLKDDRGRGAGIALAVVLLAVGAAGAVYELRSPPPVPAPSAPAAATPAAPATSVPAAPTPAAPAEEVDNCHFPGMVPTIPRGATATPEDMKTQHDAIQGFVHALEDYQKCEFDKITPATDEATKQRLTQLGNRAVDEARALANAFGAELKIYHDKHPEPLPEK